MGITLLLERCSKFLDNLSLCVHFDLGKICFKLTIFFTAINRQLSSFILPEAVNTTYLSFTLF